MSKTREIINKYFSDSQSPKVVRNFTLWISDKRNQAEKELALQEVWEGLEVSADASTEKSLACVSAQINSSPKQAAKAFFSSRLLRIAAFFILPICTMGITYFITKTYLASEDVALIECIVPNGETRTIILPDSSRVTVNSGSILVYPERFSSSRDIFLQGEAYFKVRRNESKPFVVRTADMDVRVLGTVFNVSSYADEGESSTTLTSGKVSLRLKNTEKGEEQEEIILQPNEQLCYNRRLGSINKRQVDAAQSSAWVDGGLIIQNKTLEEVVRLVERKYAIKVYISANDYMKERLSMKVMHGEDIQEFMHILKYLIPQMNYQITDNNLYIH